MSTKYIASNWRLPNEENSGKSDNYGLTFDGGSEYIAINDGVSLDSNGYSISVWFNANSFSSLQVLFFNTSSNIKFISIDSATSIRIRDGVNERSYTVPSMSVNNWYNIILTVDNGSCKVFLNTTESTTGAQTVNQNWTINGINGYSNFHGYSFNFNGSISEVAIFDYALSEPQISTLYGSSSLGAGNPMALPTPVAYYPLGDNSASNPLTQPNVAVPDASVFDFNGVDSFVSIYDGTAGGGPSSLKFTSTDSFSISCWVNMVATSGQENIISFRGTPLIWLYRSGTTIGFRVRGDGSGNQPAITKSTTNGAWHNIVAIRDYNGGSPQLKLYIDNIPATPVTDTSTGGFDTYDKFSIGNDNYLSGRYWFEGKISNVQIWNTDLQDSDIATLYNNGQPLMTGTQPQEANLQAWYKLDQSANWEADSSGDWQIPDAVSAYPQSFNFNGSTDYITTGIIDLGTENSISFWFNQDVDGNTQFLIGSPDGANRSIVQFDYNRITIRPDGNTQFLGPYRSPRPPFNYPGVWGHYLITRNGNTVRLFVNGQEQTVSGSGTMSANTRINAIGAGLFPSPARFIDGQLSNVQLWNSDLSSSAETLYNNGVPLTTAIATDNLKAWYKLNDNEKFDGTDWSVENQKYPANWENALNFNGTSDHITLPTITLADDWSVSVWMKHPTLKLRAQAVGTSTGSGFFAYGAQILSGGGDIGKLAYYNGVAYIPLSNNRLDDGNWHHWIITYKNSTTTLKCFVDGEENYDDTYDAGTGNTINRISNTFASNYWKGELSNIAIFNTDLDSPAITALYNNGTPETTISSSPISWWKLDNLTTGIQDSVGSNNGTNNGATKVNTFVSTEAGVSSGMTEQNLVNNNVSALNGESSGMTSANLVLTDLTRNLPYDSYSFNFDAASSDYINIYNGTVGSLPSEFSIGASDSASFSFWIKSNTTSSNTFIYTQRGSAPYLRFYTNYHSATDSYRTIFTVRDDSSVEVSESSDATNIVNRNQWNHIVGIIDRNASKLYVYVNGVVTGTGTSLGSLGAITQVTDIAIGGDPYPSGSIRFEFDGQISNCSIFNEALTSTEVLKLYSNGVPQDLANFTPSPVAWYSLGSNSFWNGSQWTVRDMIGSNDGTGQNIGVDGLVGDSPRSEANGTGTNMDVPSNLEGSTKWSDNNSWSINMSESARVEDTP